MTAVGAWGLGKIECRTKAHRSEAHRTKAHEDIHKPTVVGQKPTFLFELVY